MSAPCAPKDAPKKGTAHQKAAPRGATEPQLHQMKQAVQRNLEDYCIGKEYNKYFPTKKLFNLSY